MNKTIITGNLVKDPTFGATASGRTVSNFDVACDWRTSNGDGRTDYFHVSLWDERANAAKTLAKGSKVLLEGRMVAKVYQSMTGEWRARLEMYDPRLEYLSPRIRGGDDDYRADAPCLAAAPQPVEVDDLPY